MGGKERREEIERKKKKNWNGESKIKRPKEETRVERWRGKKTQKIRTEECETQGKESQGSRSAGEGTADKRHSEGSRAGGLKLPGPPAAREASH